MQRGDVGWVAVSADGVAHLHATRPATDLAVATYNPYGRVTAVSEAFEESHGEAARRAFAFRKAPSAIVRRLLALCGTLVAVSVAAYTYDRWRNAYVSAAACVVIQVLVLGGTAEQVRHSVLVQMSVSSDRPLTSRTRRYIAEDAAELLGVQKWRVTPSSSSIGLFTLDVLTDAALELPPGQVVLRRASSRGPVRARFLSAVPVTVRSGGAKQSGMWSEFDAFTACVPDEAAACAEGKRPGTRRKRRVCTPPENGGAPCEGEAEVVEACEAECSCVPATGECDASCHRVDTDAKCRTTRRACDTGACLPCQYDADEFEPCGAECTKRERVLTGGSARECKGPEHPCTLGECTGACDPSACCAAPAELFERGGDRRCVVWGACKLHAEGSTRTPWCVDGALPGQKQAASCVDADGQPCTVDDVPCDAPCVRGGGAWSKWTPRGDVVVRERETCVAEGLTSLDCDGDAVETLPVQRTHTPCEDPFFESEGRCVTCDPGTYRDAHTGACTPCPSAQAPACIAECKRLCPH